MSLVFVRAFFFLLSVELSLSTLLLQLANNVHVNLRSDTREASKCEIINKYNNIKMK